MTTLSIDHTLGRLAEAAGSFRRAQQRYGVLRRRAAGAVDLMVRGVWHVWRNRRYLTVTKLVNMAVIGVQCRFKTERVVGMPYRMKIEPTNICNTKCQLCPTGLDYPGRAKGKMTYDQYTRLIDQVRRYVYTVDLSMWGDPLIVPDIFRMIRYAHDSRIWTYISSNLHAFKPHKGQAEALVRSGLDLLTCSLHGASQKTYEIYQPGKRLDESLAKIRAIQETKRRLGSATPAIQLNFVVTKFNQHEIEDFRRLAESLDCKAVFSSPSLNLRFMENNGQTVNLSIEGQTVEQRLQEHMDRWLPDDPQYVIEPYRLIRDGHDTGGEQFNGRKIMDCQWPWKDTVINYDGSVVTCCGVFDPSDDFANAFERPLHEIWNSPAYRQARRSFKHRVDDVDGQANPCRTCPGFMV
jgi:MoaA/NifB/PqqE/SkfB family radical SAM enzyme